MLQEFFEKMNSFSEEQLSQIVFEANKELLMREDSKKKLFELILCQHDYKAGKAWVARIDNHRKRLGWVEPHSVVRDRYEIVKTYLLPDGHYESNESGSKRTESRKIFEIRNGEKI